MKNEITRRHFTNTVIAGASLAASSGGWAKVSANDKIGVALIGTNGMGKRDLWDHLRLDETECIALCDVDETPLNKLAKEVEEKTGKKPGLYKDFRSVLDKKDIDVVINATPDHWHALPAILACEAGKDVYVEKPLSLTIGEGRQMVNAARKYNRVVQMGTQQRSAEHYRKAVMIVKAGEIGKVRLVKAWAYLDWVSRLPHKKDQPPPPGVDYDMWLGPAPKSPFNPNRFHFNFRWYWDYSGGLMTDWGAHMIDIVNYAMDAGQPKAVTSIGGKFGYPDDAMQTPDTQQALFEYDDFSVIWEHALGVGRGPWDREHGVAFHGNKGILIVDRDGWEIIPETDKPRGSIREYQMKGVPRQPGSSDYHFEHVKNFIDCVKSRKRPNSDVEIGHNSMKACHLANIAIRLNKQIIWDDQTEIITNDKEANKLIYKPYRSPWKLPDIKI